MPRILAEQVDTLEICFDMLADRECVTQAEADARARAVEAGSDDGRAALGVRLAHEPAARLLRRAGMAGA